MTLQQKVCELEEKVKILKQKRKREQESERVQPLYLTVFRRMISNQNH